MPPDTVLEHKPWLGSPGTAEDALILAVVLSALDDGAANRRSSTIAEMQAALAWNWVTLWSRRHT